MIKILDVAKKVRKNPNKILENIIFRWSPRSMNGVELPEEIIIPLFDAARYSASAFNEQPQRYYYAARDSKSFNDLINLLSSYNQVWCKNASFLIILVSKKKFDRNNKFSKTHSFDTGASWEAFAVEGVKRNLVVHAMSGFDYEKAHQYLKLNDDYQIECMIAVGIPTDKIIEDKVSTRKSIDEIVISLE